MSKVLVAYDGSEVAGRALDAAVRMAGADGQIVVISVVPVQQGTRGGGIDPTSNVDDHRAMLAEASRRIAERGATARTLEAVGHPADTIVAAAEQEGADLVVVGRRGLGAVERFLVGSTSSRVVGHAHCDVLVVH